MSDRDDRVREIALFLWLDEGCPEGQAERHWAAAESLHDSDFLERKRIEGEPPGDPAGDFPTQGPDTVAIRESRPLRRR